MKGPWRITFDTNPDDCNLKCIMCEEFSPYSNLKQLRLVEGSTPKKRRMNLDIIEKVLSEVTENYNSLKEIIPSTMGEPLLYKEFERIIEYCKKYDVKLNLTTNGTFPRKSAKEWAELLVPVLSDIKISWNGFTKETQEKVMRNSNYEKAIRNLRDFLRVRDEYALSNNHYASVTLQVTFMEMNYREFPDLIKMAIGMGIDRVKGHHLWAHFPEIKNESMRRDADSIERWNTMVKEAITISQNIMKPDGTAIKLENFFELDNNADKLLLSDSECPFLSNEAWVAWDGRFNPCCAPDAERRTLGDFGNLQSSSFMEIWEGEKYNNLVKNYDSIPLCKGCNMRRKIE